MSDLTSAECQDQYLGGYKPLPHLPSSTPSYVSHSGDLPASVDWREKGAVSPVKNQGQCGSCWAQTTTEVIESYVQIATGHLPILSPQQITSCTPNPLHCGGTGGCHGSEAQLAFNYVQLFGQTTEELYP